MKCCQGAAAVNDGKAVFLRLAAVLEKSGKFQVRVPERSKGRKIGEFVEIGEFVKIGKFVG